MSSLETMDYNLFRQKLAGLVDPNVHEPGAAEHKEIRETAARFCSILAKLFSSDLDRLTLWDRIGSALVTSIAKVSDDDVDRFATLCLEHVKADPGQVAACEPLLQILTTAQSRPPEWRYAFLNYFGTHSFAVVAHGRARWERVKSKEIDL